MLTAIEWGVCVYGVGVGAVIFWGKRRGHAKRQINIVILTFTFVCMCVSIIC